MDIRNIISVDFKGKQKVSLPSRSLNGPGIRRSRERILLPGFDFLFKGRSLAGIIQILNRANVNPVNEQRYSYHMGFTPRQWCAVLEREVKKARPFSNN